MPGPFPGMDPYLEHPAYWRMVHLHLVAEISNALNALLPPGYAAMPDERLRIVQPDRDIYPDLAGIEHPRSPEALPTGRGGTAVAEAVDAPWIVKVFPIELREPFIEIVRTSDPGKAVTIIELLSPTNKAPGSEGHRLYLEKQKSLLGSETNLIEIDLLHQGEHTVAAPYEHLLQIGLWDYLICVHRTLRHYEFEVWAVSLRERLPRIAIPLAGDDPDVVLDLQAAFDRFYDAGPSARILDYRKPPRALLKPVDLLWIDQILREKGLRPAESTGEEQTP